MGTRKNLACRSALTCALGAAVFLGALVGFGAMQEVSARENVSVRLNLGDPPREVIVAPGDVFFVPGPNIAAFFFDGSWWTARNNHWYRSRDYRGTWVGVRTRYVPVPVYSIYEMPDYRKLYGRKDDERISYDQWRENGYRRISQDSSDKQLQQEARQEMKLEIRADSEEQKSQKEQMEQIERQKSSAQRSQGK